MGGFGSGRKPDPIKLLTAAGNSNPSIAVVGEQPLNFPNFSGVIKNIEDQGGIDYLKLNTSNGPLTGDLTISKASPVFTLSDTTLGNDVTFTNSAGLFTWNVGSANFKLQKGGISYISNLSDSLIIKFKGGVAATGTLGEDDGFGGVANYFEWGNSSLTAYYDLSVPAETYGAGWNGSNEVPTKNDVYDKIETLGVSFGAQYQIPFTNATTDDFDYSSLFTFDGTHLRLLSDTSRIYFGAGNDASIHYNGSHLIITPDVVGSGNVGIGTTNPFAKLSVADNGTNIFGSIYRFARFTNGAETGGLNFGYSNTEQIGTIASQGSNSGVSFWTHNGSWGERMRLHTNGYLGIGTTSPECPLHIQGNASSVSVVIDNDSYYCVKNSTGLNVGIMKVDSSNNTHINAQNSYNILFTVGSNDEKFRIDDNHLYIRRDDARLYFGAGDDSSIYFDGTNQQYVSGGYHYFTTTGASNFLYVRDTGVNIIRAEATDNTTSSVASNASYTNNASLNLIAHASARTLTRFGITLGGWAELLATTGLTGNPNGLIIGTENASPILFGTNNLERMRLLSSGELGIGKTPSYKLDVNGTINGTAYRVGGTAGASGTFTTADAKTVTVSNGIITSIV